MQLRVVTDQPWDVPADVLVVPVAADPVFDGPLGELDRRAAGELQKLVAFGELKGKRYATALVSSGEAVAGRILAVGLGTAADLDREGVVRVAATAERRLGGRTVKRLAVWLSPLADAIDGGAIAAAELVARGIVEGSFDPRTIYREGVDGIPPVLDELILIAPDGDAAGLTKAAERGVIMGEGANHARSLSNRAANDVSPEVLAEEARDVAKKHGLWIDVIEPDRATKLGMGMFMAIGRGSDNPPRLIVMRSGEEGQRDALDRHLAIVGKGVCFDSGGISIKPGDRMDEMKMDKTGACTVIAAIETVARLAPGTPLLALAPAVENMPGPHSARPGDIVTALNGKKVDIINTDAEGRLILGDALTYAEQLGATHLVDVATLTGAVSRALGHLVTGAFGAPQGFYDQVMSAADTAGERYWQLPLVEDYVSELESWTGDIQNSGSAEASLVKSGLFIREFVTKPWVHLDIAGTAYYRKALPFAPRGATGVSHATLVELALAGAPGGLTTLSDAVSPLAVILALAGFLIGLAADRFATRWPEHDEEHPPGRAVDWRTATVAIVGAVALGLLPVKFGSDPLAMVVFGAWFLTLIVGLATDLDQRVLPDILTLPVIPVALVYALSGQNPLVGTDLVPAILAAVLIPAVLYLPSLPFGAGAFGMGDVKLLIGVGLLVGGSRALGTVIVALVISGIVILTLLATHRVSRKTYLPFGPFFIIAALWAVLLRP